MSPARHVASRTLRRLAAACAATSLLLLGARGLSRHLVFPTHRVIARTLPSDLALVSVTARDGVPVHALDLPAKPGQKTLVHFHNNRDTMVDGAELARALNARGLGVRLVEYRGYGLSQGAAPSEEGLYADAEAVLDDLAARGVGPRDVVLWGTSLGTGVAAEMARRGRGAALVLVTPYTSIPDIASAAVPIGGMSLLVADRFATAEKAPDIRVPTLIIHGDADEVVPFWMGERLAGAIARARLVHVVGGRHGDLFAREPERLVGAIAALSGAG